MRRGAASDVTAARQDDAPPPGAEGGPRSAARRGDDAGADRPAVAKEPSPRDVHRRLLALSPAARGFVAATVACGAVAAATVVVQAWVVAGVVGAAVDGRGPATAAIVVLGLVVLVRALAAGGTELWGRRAAEHAAHALRAGIAARALGGRDGATDEARRGDVVTAAVQGVDALGDYYARAVPAIALAGAVPVAVVAAITWRQPVVGGLLAVTLPVLVVFMILVGRASAEHARERQRALAVLGAHFLEVVRALPTLRAHGRERAQSRTLDEVAERYRAESLGALRVAFLSALVLELFAMLGIAIAAATTGVLLATGHAELSTGLFVLLLAPEVYAPLRSAGQRFHAAEDGAQAARRAFAFLDEGRERSAGDAAFDEVTAKAHVPVDPRREGAAGTSVSEAGETAAHVSADSRRRGAAGTGVSEAGEVAAHVPVDPRREGAAGDPALASDPGPRPGRGDTTAPAADPSRSTVVLRGVAVAGSAGRAPRLRPLDLDLVPGRSVALVGSSGAGKTTLLHLLARLRDPDAGTITCGGVHLRDAPPEDWWRQLAWLPQRPGLQPGSLGEALHAAAGAAWHADAPLHETARATWDVDAPPRAAIDTPPAADSSHHTLNARIARALDLADAQSVLAALPYGLDTLVGPGGRVLSAGQTQRLTLAGALASTAPLVLLDEPTAHLDAASAARAADGILEACAGRTLVVATHDHGLAARCDVVVDLGLDGSTVEARTSRRAPVGSAR